ncbi:hypothetical protein COU18_02740 [Candidatus Kaiserbacteria bacterium CG10_big_fil_rev_8_21_14_0_10_51_14]|uniref:VWFA domain-containing protein n=1 Tax=Candidatus Kaiserbacteria bacterium CG10_big_fil_rev_8_21_14_0_10_51_14 TaxID=1974610 RepID=A0A2H0UB13_9BACT|nr:MAG: hypothetical protein COU18_02740 [Candidatus Kaiserbacteria bacterium CG10_big_fil_rev_8_21_14_0_10_51_14]
MNKQALSRRGWLCAATLVAFFCARESAAQECVDTNLVLAFDASGSIDEEEWILQVEGSADAFLDPEVLRSIVSGPCGAIAVAMVRWAGPGIQRQEIALTRIDSAASAHLFAEALRAVPFEWLAGTSISGAINFSLDLLESAPFRAGRQIIDISGDGFDMGNTEELNLNAQRERAAYRGVTINGLAIVNGRAPPHYPPGSNAGAVEGLRNLELGRYYTQRVMAGPRCFVEVALGFEDFARAFRKKLLRELLM